MITSTDFEYRRLEYEARVEDINRNGWMRTAPAPTDRGTPKAIDSVGLLRWRLGEYLIRAGQQLRGAPFGQELGNR